MKRAVSPSISPITGWVAIEATANDPNDQDTRTEIADHVPHMARNSTCLYSRLVGHVILSHLRERAVASCIKGGWRIVRKRKVVGGAFFRPSKRNPKSNPQ
jgi:hypothetical protein